MNGNQAVQISNNNVTRFDNNISQSNGNIDFTACVLVRTIRIDRTCVHGKIQLSESGEITYSAVDDKTGETAFHAVAGHDVTGHGAFCVPCTGSNDDITGLRFFCSIIKKEILTGGEVHRVRDSQNTRTVEGLDRRRERGISPEGIADIRDSQMGEPVHQSAIRTGNLGRVHIVV